MKIVLILLLMYCGTVNASGKTDILKVFEHFTLTNAAAGKCIKPEKSELTSFLANYQMVTVLTLQEIQKRKSGISQEQAQEILKAGSTKATEAVHSVIAKEGCESPKIQDLIKRFHVQAKWKP
ncbi:hypothetical protein [Marinobacterium sediminicola]|uniref:hypothetical protein n=1 Tax=Marinobacterium sediminicola TaxID=518898 RepID=UPI001EF14273|nr:hypothetical protein [Marinobacterium sediminicola]ULG70316.1 hypothetical protein LN244_05750 [Marinobacterium sediminicola]